MPSFSSKVYQFSKNIYVRTIALIVFAVTLALVAMLPKLPASLRVSVPVVHSQNISEITELAAQEGPPRLPAGGQAAVGVAALRLQVQGCAAAARGQGAEHLAPEPRARSAAQERDPVFDRQGRLPGLAQGRAAGRRTERRAGRAPAGFLKRHALDILLMLLILYALKFGIPGMGMSASVITPGQAQGQHGRPDRHGRHQAGSAAPGRHDPQPRRIPVAQHRQAVQRDADRPGRHRQDQAGRLPGQAPRHAADPGVGFGAGIGLRRRRLQGAATPCTARPAPRASCIIFLDEAQSLFMPRGRSEKKWEDDTANTLLGLLDGVKSDKGAGRDLGGRLELRRCLDRDGRSDAAPLLGEDQLPPAEQGRAPRTAARASCRARRKAWSTGTTSTWTRWPRSPPT